MIQNRKCVTIQMQKTQYDACGAKSCKNAPKATKNTESNLFERCKNGEKSGKIDQSQQKLLFYSIITTFNLIIMTENLYIYLFNLRSVRF